MQAACGRRVGPSSGTGLLALLLLFWVAVSSPEAQAPDAVIPPIDSSLQNTLVQFAHTRTKSTFLPHSDTGSLTPAGTVYVAFTIDTEPRDPSITTYNQNLNLTDYLPGGLVDRLMQPSFRIHHLDRTGHPLVFSWFLLTQQLQCSSTSGDCSIIHEVMEPYRARADSLGDIYGWHYHHSDWTDTNHDGKHFWNQLRTFNGTEYGSGTDIEVAERMIAQLIIDKGVYPGPFRTGWSWENTDISDWLEDITPFDFSNLSPLHSEPASPPPTKGTTGTLTEPEFNIFDWSRSTTDWTYYHPSATDYQSPGALKRYLFRSSDSPATWDTAFIYAEMGADQLIVMFAHSYNLQSLIEQYLLQLDLIADQHPDVVFRYVTALEGARRMIFDSTVPAPPVVSVNVSEDSVTLVSDKPLFAFPYGALYINGDYQRVRPVDTTNGPSLPDYYSWTFDLCVPLSQSENATFRIGGVDPYGNTFVTSPIYFSSRIPSVCGDFNGDGTVDISDLISLTGYFFDSMSIDIDASRADLDGSGALDIADLVYLVEFSFNNGPAPTGCP